jgi:hypothetical protein
MDKPITVGALRDKIASLPDDTPIILASDPEGNGFYLLFDLNLNGTVEIEYDDCQVTGLVLWP